MHAHKTWEQVSYLMSFMWQVLSGLPCFSMLFCHHVLHLILTGKQKPGLPLFKRSLLQWVRVILFPPTSSPSLHGMGPTVSPKITLLGSNRQQKQLLHESWQNKPNISTTSSTWLWKTYIVSHSHTLLRKRRKGSSNFHCSPCLVECGVATRD